MLKWLVDLLSLEWFLGPNIGKLINRAKLEYDGGWWMYDAHVLTLKEKKALRIFIREVLDGPYLERKQTVKI